jgi:hypothetical protein
MYAKEMEKLGRGLRRKIYTNEGSGFLILNKPEQKRQREHWTG